MNNTYKIKLLSEIDDLITELSGIDGLDFQRIGITMFEYENPTTATVVKLRNYVNSLHTKDRENHNYEK